MLDRDLSRLKHNRTNFDNYIAGYKQYKEAKKAEQKVSKDLSKVNAEAELNKLLKG
ncbi:hypothetical protein [Priestia aryabhattai]|uniref:hypothetical protein n=1 Tax=Priestia aryabhattai TaxID=412384 RepID=UPI0030C9850C